MKLLFDQNLSYKLVKRLADLFPGSTQALLGHPPKVIWLRCGNQPTDYIERLIRSRFREIRKFEGDTSVSCLEIY